MHLAEIGFLPSPPIDHGGYSGVAWSLFAYNRARARLECRRSLEDHQSSRGVDGGAPASRLLPNPRGGREDVNFALPTSRSRADEGHVRLAADPPGHPVPCDGLLP